MDETIRLRPLSQLKRWNRNYRVGDVDAIIASIIRFGFNGSLRVWKDGEVMAGNHALVALQTIKAQALPAPQGVVARRNQWLIPCVDVSHLNRLEAQAYAIADNRTQELGRNDPEALAELLKEIVADGSLDGVGYTEDDLDALVKQVAGMAKKELEAPEPDDPTADDFGEVRAVAGDIWSLGEHRLLCGDSTDLGQVQRLMDGRVAKLMATDPPYLVNYTGDDRPGTDKGKDWSELYHEVDIKDAKGFFTGLFRVGLAVIDESAAIYCWHASKRAHEIEQIWADLGIHYHQQIVWVKPCATLGYSMYPWRHEPCLMGWRKGHKPDRLGSWTHELTSVWEVDWEGKAKCVGNDHPTQKPLELFAIPMRTHTQEGDLVFEPFSGSGSQICAAERENRVCFAAEIEPRFVEVALRRWERMTGKAAVLLHRAA